MIAIRGKRLKVCMLIPKLHVGGAEMQVLSLLKNLDGSRFKVHLCCFTHGDEEMEGEAARYAADVHLMRFRWALLPIFFSRLVGYLRHGRFDVLHCHLPLADFLGRAAGKLAGVPVLVTTEHGRHPWKSPLHLFLERFLNPVTDARMCVSRDILDIRGTRERTPGGKLLYIPNAVDTGRFRSGERGKAGVMAEFGWESTDPLVVSVGRLVPAKDYPVLVEAVGILRKDHPDARCLIVGEGRSRGDIEHSIMERGLAAHVVLAGKRRDIPDILAAGDVFVLSSVSEGLPVSLLEAMAAGKAIVATGVGGIPDAVTDRGNGLIVPARDAGAIAAGIGELLSNEDLAGRLSASAAEEAEASYGVTAISERIGDVYERLYALKRGAPKSSSSPRKDVV